MSEAFLRQHLTGRGTKPKPSSLTASERKLVIEALAHTIDWFEGVMPPSRIRRMASLRKRLTSR